MQSATNVCSDVAHHVLRATGFAGGEVVSSGLHVRVGSFGAPDFRIVCGNRSSLSTCGLWAPAIACGRYDS